MGLVVGETAELREIDTEPVCVAVCDEEAVSDSEVVPDADAATDSEAVALSLIVSEALPEAVSEAVCEGVSEFDGDTPIVRPHTHCLIDVHSVVVVSELKYKSLS